MADFEKPRERLLLYGASNLSNEELLSILLRTGTKNTSVKTVAMNILKELSSLNDLDKIGINRLATVKGVGEIKAMSIIAALELGRRIYLDNITKKAKLNNTEIIYEMFKNKFKYANQEKLIAIFLNIKKEMISYKTIFIGTIDGSTVHPRDVFREALNISASYIIIIHNHPSGDSTPSVKDIEFTKDIEKTGLIMSIPLIDHIIFGNNNFSSYFDSKWGDPLEKVI